MNTKKWLLYAGVGALAYYLYKKKNNAMISNDDPGVVKKFTNQVKESFSKELEEVGSDIPSKTSVGMS
ncbi:MAG: hypothetical protein ABIO04_00535 [Ferruginibacter sp.]